MWDDRVRAGALVVLRRAHRPAPGRRSRTTTSRSTSTGTRRSPTRRSRPTARRPRLRASGDQPQALARCASANARRPRPGSRPSPRSPASATPSARVAAQTRRSGAGGSVGRTTRSERSVGSARSGSSVDPEPGGDEALHDVVVVGLEPDLGLEAGAAAGGEHDLAAGARQRAAEPARLGELGERHACPRGQRMVGRQRQVHRLGQHAGSARGRAPRRLGIEG